MITGAEGDAASLFITRSWLCWESRCIPGAGRVRAAGLSASSCGCLAGRGVGVSGGVKSLQQNKKKSSQKRTYRRVGRPHRHAQDEAEQRHGEGLQVLLHLVCVCGGDKTRIRLR